MVKKNRFEDASTNVCANHLMQLGMNGKSPLIEDTLAMYANKNNWIQVHKYQRCFWAWAGPTICAYELAQTTLRQHNSNNAYLSEEENKQNLTNIKMSGMPVVEDFDMKHISSNADGSVTVGGHIKIAGDVDNTLSEKIVSQEKFYEEQRDFVLLEKFSRYWCCWSHLKSDVDKYTVDYVPFQFWVKGMIKGSKEIPEDHVLVYALLEARNAYELFRGVEKYFPNCNWRFIHEKDNDFTPDCIEYGNYYHRLSLIE